MQRQINSNMEVQSEETSLYNISGKQQEGLIYYLGLLLWPFGVTVSALKNLDKPWSRNVFWLFCIFFGFTFIVAEDIGDSADSVRYAQLLGEYARSHMNLTELWRSFYAESSGFTDIAQPLLTYLVSRVTQNTSILFAIFGFIFGYFYSRNLSFVYTQVKGKVTPIILLYMLTFALLNPIWNINSFRMWTASHIFLYGALPFLLEGNKKRLLWSGISVFFHFSFFFALGILLIYSALKNRYTIFFALFLLTSFIKELDLTYVQSILSFLPDIFQIKVTSYTNQDYAELVNTNIQAFNWYLPYSSKSLEWVIYALVIFSYVFCRRYVADMQGLISLYSFSLLMYSASNIFSLVPSGDRFMVVSNTFMFAFFIIFFVTFSKNRGLNLLKVLSIPFLVLFCLVSVRIGMDYYGLVTIFGNPLFAILNTDAAPLITGIKGLL